MDKKTINKHIRKIATSTALPVLAFILITKIIQSILAFVYSFSLKEVSANSILRDDGFYNFIIYILLYFVTIPVTALIYQKVKGNKVGINLKSLYRKPQKSAAWCFRWIIISMGFAYIALYASNLIFTLIEYLTGITLNQADMDFGNSIFGTVILVIAPIIFAPIFEELLFRGVVLKNCEPMGQWFAIIMSGIIFGLWHCNYPQFLFAATLGCFSAYMVVKTRSIIPSMIVHFIINTASTLMQIIIRATGFDVSSIQNNLIESSLMTDPSNLGVTLLLSCFGFFNIAIIILGVVLFVIELAKRNKEKKLLKSVFDISTPKKIAVFFSSPAMLITFVLMLALTVFNAIPKA